MIRAVVRHLAAACLGGLAFVAAASGADGPSATVAADPVTPAAVPAAPEAAAEPTGSHDYPRVNMAGCGRGYRVIPTQASESDLEIRSTLTAPQVDFQPFDFQEVPLRAVLEQLEESFEVPIVIDWQALTEAGIDADATTATVKVPPNLSLRQVLRLVLDDIGLTWIAADGVLRITTREAAQQRPVIVAYPVPRGCGAGQSDGGRSTIDLIQATVAPQTWELVGGPATIRQVDMDGVAMLVVSQVCEVHDEIESLLRRIHETLLADFAGGRPVPRVHRVRDAASRARLADTLVGLCNESLGAAGDPDAEVTTVGATLLVRSRSPEFHALVAQLIAAVDGAPASGGDGPPAP